MLNENKSHMKRILLILSLSLAVLPSVAGNGDKFFNLSAGWQWKNTVNAIIGFEAETKYHNAWEMYVIYPQLTKNAHNTELWIVNHFGHTKLLELVERINL